MSNETYISLSSQLALTQRIETISRNLANLSTPGYRSENITFSTTLAKIGDQSLAFAAPGKSHIVRTSGGLARTGNSLDVAVKGDAWFSIQTPAGAAHTRDGRLTIQANGRLVTVTGYPILDAAGQPIQVDPQAGKLTIGADGMISQNKQQIGAIGLFTIPPEAKLTRGPAASVYSDPRGDAVLEFDKYGIAQGFTENSNVNPVQQIAQLVAIQRTFDMVSGGMEMMGSSKLDAIKSLGSNV